MLQRWPQCPKRVHAGLLSETRRARGFISRRRNSTLGGNERLDSSGARSRNLPRCPLVRATKPLASLSNSRGRRGRCGVRLRVRRYLLGEVTSRRHERRGRHRQWRQRRLRTTRLSTRLRTARRLGRRGFPLLERELQALCSTRIDPRTVGIAERLTPQSRQPLPGPDALDFVLCRRGRVLERPRGFALVPSRQQALHEHQPRVLVTWLEAHGLTQLVQRPLGVTRGLERRHQLQTRLTRHRPTRFPC
ncbi:hypothetical protein WA016_02093 [Myxococcus stipitatus]